MKTQNDYFKSFFAAAFILSEASEEQAVRIRTLLSDKFGFSSNDFITIFDSIDLSAIDEDPSSMNALLLECFADIVEMSKLNDKEK